MYNIPSSLFIQLRERERENVKFTAYDDMYRSRGYIFKGESGLFSVEGK